MGPCGGDGGVGVDDGALLQAVVMMAMLLLDAKGRTPGSGVRRTFIGILQSVRPEYI